MCLRGHKAMKTVLLGQALSFSITVGGSVNEYLFRKYSLNLSSLLTFSVYLVLALIFTPKFLITRKRGDQNQKPLKDRLILYAAFAFFDVVASYLVIKSYTYIGISLIALFSTASTPFLMLLSKTILRKEFKNLHYVGAFLCIFGTVFLSCAVGFGNTENSHNNLVGSVLVVVSALSYAGSNLLAEVIGEKAESDAEFLAFLGIFGSLWSGVFTCVQIFREIRGLLYYPIVCTWLSCVYVIATVSFYCLIPVFLKRASAALFNLSLFTINIYSFLAGVLLFKDPFSWSYPVAFILVASGIVIYSLQ